MQYHRHSQYELGIVTDAQIRNRNRYTYMQYAAEITIHGRSTRGMLYHYHSQYEPDIIIDVELRNRSRYTYMQYAAKITNVG